jgi:putative transposase
MDVPDAKRLKALEAENHRLKKLVAERDLEIEAMKEISARNGERACSTAAGRVRAEARPVVPTSLRADPSCPVVAPLPVAVGVEGRAGAPARAPSSDGVSAVGG